MQDSVVQRYTVCDAIVGIMGFRIAPRKVDDGVMAG
jgi:hypothetical protein